MLFEPHVEELSKKCGNTYILANLLGKRAKELAITKEKEDIVEKTGKGVLQIAAEEIYNGEVVAGEEK